MSHSLRPCFTYLLCAVSRTICVFYPFAQYKGIMSDLFLFKFVARFSVENGIAEFVEFGAQCVRLSPIAIKPRLPTLLCDRRYFGGDIVGLFFAFDVQLQTEQSVEFRYRVVDFATRLEFDQGP